MSADDGGRAREPAFDSRVVERQDPREGGGEARGGRRVREGAAGADGAERRARRPRQRRQRPVHQQVRHTHSHTISSAPLRELCPS